MSATRVALSGRRDAQLDVRKYTTTWSPLRNRTVGLLLTMNDRTVLLPQAGPVISQKREHRPAPTSLGWALTSTVCHLICHSV